jgi:hypothetical protein
MEGSAADLERQVFSGCDELTGWHKVHPNGNGGRSPDSGVTFWRSRGPLRVNGFHPRREDGRCAHP